MPLVIELDHREATSVQEHMDELARLGFTLEAFGGRSVAVKSVPQMLADTDIERLLRNVAAELAETGRASGINEAFDEVLILMACHGMVRANQPLTRAEMEALLSEMAEIDFSSHCPHGRPVVWKLGRNDVERHFHRR
jgi:DNA mismatch repair protein MutL